MARERGEKQIAANRKARHEYFVEETYECGLALHGTEVKSMRQGRVNLKGSVLPGKKRRDVGYRHAHQPLRAGQHLQRRPAAR